MSDNAIGAELAGGDTEQTLRDDNRQDQLPTSAKDLEPDSGHKYAEKDKAEEERRSKRRPLVVAVGILVVILLAAGELFYWLSTRDLETTDDAYTDGRAIAIAPQVSGMPTRNQVTQVPNCRPPSPHSSRWALTGAAFQRAAKNPITFTRMKKRNIERAIQSI